MRHLIDTYIEADEPRKISPFDDMRPAGADREDRHRRRDRTAARRHEGQQGCAVAETIENNVRSKIIKEHLNDPAYYEKMSALLDEIIAARKAKAIEYEEYLKRIAELAKKVEAGQAEDYARHAGYARQAGALQQSGPGRGTGPPDRRHGEGQTAGRLGAASRPASRSSRRLCTAVLQDEAEVERIFLIIKAQAEY